MSNRPGLPSASGARLSGDDYQHAYTWLNALDLLRPERGIVRIEFEARQAGNVDDLIVHRADGLRLFHQVKYVVDQRAPLSAEWFTTVEAGAAASPLSRFWASFTRLGGAESPPELALITNRQIAADDPVLRHLSGREDKLAPRLGVPGSRSASGRARRAWADHLEIDEDELLGMLGHLSIRAGRSSLAELRDQCATAMAAAGLSGLDANVDLGLGIVRRLIGEGTRSLGPEQMRHLVGEAGLQGAPREATLLVQAIERTHYAEYADAHVDWLDLFLGESVPERRQLRDPGDWNARLRPDLRSAAAALAADGLRVVRIEGAFRLSVGFAIGETLARAAGFTLQFRDYRSDVAPERFAIATSLAHIGAGADLAVGISVSDDLTPDVLAYIGKSGLPVGRLVTIAPGAGAGQHSIPTPAAAVGFVDAAVSAIRAAAREGDGNLHLFLCCPNAIAILLGHLWNRMPSVQNYEDANRPGEYFKSFWFPR